MIGRVISHFKILEKLGGGGMGVVYKAEDTRLHRPVALKFLPLEWSEDSKAKQRFIQEARAASALDHPNICTIYDIDETEEGQLFIAMAYYGGETLKKKIERGPLYVEEALEITRQIAGGLASAHEQGIVHRDVKPANVVITEDATAKLLDFGVAKVLDSTRLTKSGSALGTLVYMSPEQLRGEDIGRQADLWSLAAVLYEMLSGRPPFAAKNEGALIHSILNRVPEDLTDSRSDVSPALELVLRKALAKEVEARYPTMDAFIVALDQARDDDAPTAIRETAAKDELGDRPVVAVLDFVNITRDPAADWLSTGIAESITTDLKKISSLKVIDRAKLQRVMGLDSAQELSEAELREEGMKVGTRWLFWGGYQKSGPSVRITAELLDVKEGRIVDSMKLDGSMDGIFALQDRLIARLTDLIDVELSDTEKRRIETPETYDLKAYEAYAKGRRLVNQMQRHTIAEAQQHFEKALEIDPEYALAYSGLGMLYTMRYVATSDREDLEMGIAQLQRALELDPEIGDPYLWLTYAFAREDRFSEALEAGRRAVQLEADNPLSHYFLGAALWLHGIAEHDKRSWIEAEGHLQKCCTLAPKYQAAYQVLGDIHIRNGRYRDARGFLKKAAAIEESGEGEPVQFVGALTMLGRLAYRQGLIDEASDLYERALGILDANDHVYTPAMTALTHCGMAEVLFERRQYDEALRPYGRAIEVVNENPRALGIGWMLIRAHAGMAACFHQLGMTREEKDSYMQARDLLDDAQGFDLSRLWEGGEAEILFELARYHALAHRLEKTGEFLRKAVECGWSEPSRLENDSRFDGLRDDPQVKDIVESLN